MGQQAQRKRQRREVLAVARDTRLRSRPDIVAQLAEQQADSGLQGRWQADYPAQRRRLLHGGWRQAQQGGDGAGWWVHAGDPGGDLTLVHSVSREDDGNLWGHVSLSQDYGRKLPLWHQLHAAHWLLYPDLTAVQVLAPASGHVNISEAAHAWTCLTADLIPDFGKYGSI
jgi:hypothetical protein